MAGILSRWGLGLTLVGLVVWLAYQWGYASAERANAEAGSELERESRRVERQWNQGAEAAAKASADRMAAILAERDALLKRLRNTPRPAPARVVPPPACPAALEPEPAAPPAERLSPADGEFLVREAGDGELALEALRQCRAAYDRLR